MTPVRQLDARLSALRRRVDALRPRERVLLFASVLLVVTVLWYMALIEPLTERAELARTRIGAQQDRIDAANQSIEDLVLQYSATDSEMQRRALHLRGRIDEINTRLGDFAAELIDPAEMARVVEEVLREQSTLKLIRVRNLSAEPLIANNGPGTTTLYKHRLEIEFEGTYFACLEYLEDIEALPWRLYWQVIDLEAADYPVSRVRIEVSTLSLNEEWIGA